MESLKSIFSFSRGFLMAFGFPTHHLDEAAKTIISRTDADAIKSDWLKIGVDVRNSFSECSKKVDMNAG